MLVKEQQDKDHCMQATIKTKINQWKTNVNERGSTKPTGFFFFFKLVQ